jgi:hypothetical protein
MPRKSKPARKPSKSATKKSKPGRKTEKAPAKKRKSAPKSGKPLTPEGRRKRRQANLKAFEKFLPDIHAKLVSFAPASRLEYDENGVPDIVFNDQYFYNKKTNQYVADQLKGYWANPLRFSLQTLNPGQFDKYAGQYLHNLLKRATEQGLTFAPAAIDWKSYFVLSFGVGLGGHIDPLVEETDCYAIIFVEPSLEFVHHSLEVYDWKALFERMEERKGRVFLFVDNKPDYIARQIRVAIRGTSPMSLDGMMIFSHYNNAVFAKLAQLLHQDRDLIIMGLGFLDDEILMIQNAHGNLYQGNSRIYLRPPNRPMPLPAFVVGSGPSLDRDIKVIKENADKAIVISCGSAVRPLLKNGIIPDFQVELENIGILPLVKQVAAEHDLSPIRLLTSVTGERESLKYFKDVIYYFRASLSPYPLFFQSELQTLRYCNPTVSNAALSFAQEIGCRVVYLFGTDMGSLDPSRHHSKDAYHYTKGAEFKIDDYTTPIPANFGGQCYTNMGLYWARDALSTAMKSLAAGRRYYNCANGAFIDGSLAKRSDSIDLKDVPGGKTAVIEKLVAGFTTYTTDLFDRYWQDDLIVETMTNYLESIGKVIEAVEDFDNKRYLTDMLSILEDTSARMSATMALMFRGTIYMAQMGFEFYRDRLTDRTRLRDYDDIGREEMMAFLEILRDTAIAAVGKLSEQAGPRERMEISA